MTSSSDSIIITMPGDRESRRNALVNAILAAFENRGWTWSDEEVFDGIKKSFTNPKELYLVWDSDYDIRPAKELQPRLEIAYTFGESQVKPFEGVLPTLVKDINSEMLKAIRDSDTTVYDTVASHLVDPLFEREMHALLVAKDTLPVLCGLTEHHGYRTIRKLLKDLSLIPDTILDTTAFSTVLWIFGIALETVEHRPEISRWLFFRYSNQTEIDTGLSYYRKYVRAERRARTVRRDLCRRLSRLPKELRVLIFVAVAEDMEWERIEPRGDSLDWAARLLVHHLCDTKFEPVYIEDLPFRPRRELCHHPNEARVMNTFREEMKEAIVKTLCLEQRFWGSDRTRRIITSPIELPLGTLGDFLADLAISVHFVEFRGRENVVRPSSVYRVQDYLPAIKTHFPGLKRIEMKVNCEDNLWHDAGERIYISRTPDEEYTTVERELEKLVQILMGETSFREVDYKYWRLRD